MIEVQACLHLLDAHVILGRTSCNHVKSRHEDSDELRHKDRKRRKKKMMALEAGYQQEAKIANKTSRSVEDCSVDAAAFGSANNNNNNSSSLAITTNTSSSNNNISKSLEASSNNNNSNSNINTSTITSAAIASNNSSNNLKSMPRQRIPKSIQNDSCGEKTVQQAADVSKTSRSQEERFHRNFPDLASCSDDMLIRTYHCALVTDILLQGYLYITSRWFCFYSKLFGKKKLIKIPLSLVLEVSKKKTAKFIPNAVGVTTLNKEYLFGSLLSRDSTYRVMCNAWHSYKSNAKENGSSPESEMSETNEELLSLDSRNTVTNQSESTSYEESFSNVEEDGVDSCDLKVGEEVPSSEGERCPFDLEKPTRKKHKKSVYSLFEFVGYVLNMSSPSKTCMFLIVASILTAMLLVSAFILSCQLSNLEVLFARIVTKTSSQSAQQTHGSMAGMDGRSGVVRTGDYIDDDDNDDDDLISKPAPGGDGTEANESEDCQSHKENLFLANLREISTMHQQLLHQINKILTALQRVTFNASLSGTEPLH